jgi:hypothetical protein
MRKILFVVVLVLLLSPAEADYFDLAWDLNQEPDLIGYSSEAWGREILRG